MNSEEIKQLLQSCVNICQLKRCNIIISLQVNTWNSCGPDEMWWYHDQVRSCLPACILLLYTFYMSLNSTHIPSQRFSLTSMPPGAAPISPPQICRTLNLLWLLLNRIWKILWYLVYLFISSQRRNRRGWSDTSTSTAGRRSASRSRGKAWLTSSPQCRDSSSSLGTIP